MLHNEDLEQDDDVQKDNIVDSNENETHQTEDHKETASDDEEEDVNLDDLIADNPNDTSGTPHDEFDWSRGKINKVKYSESEEEKYLKEYENTLNTVSEFEVVKARVTSITDNDVILDINYKSDGMLALSDFRDMPDLKPGDYVDVYVENKEDSRGQLVLSRRKAKLIKAWDMLVDSYKNGTIIKGHIVSKTKGGLIAECSGLETFLPGSQIDVKPITDYDAYVGKTMEFKVVKINEAIKNAVVSHKALIESDIAEQREAIILGLEKGQVLEGTVKNITDFGAFMDLGGVDGLLYITDISWGRINHPSEVLEMNQKINVCVLDFDDDKKRISLGLKQLTPHPWDVIDNGINEGSTVSGKIVNIEDYGAFLEITPGVEGLIHVSEVSWSNQPVNAREFFNLGDTHEAKVVTIDRDERKMSLSLKQLVDDPWDKVSEKYSINSRHTGEVKNLTPYGVFVELEQGIGGMIHISDLSWTKRYGHPSEFTKVGENIEVSVLELDQETRKLTLGHKQTEENPWDTFENVFPVGSYHEATIMKKDDRGAIVQLPYGLEAYAPMKHLRKENGQAASAEETLTFKVIEFNRDDKRIIVSHSRFVEDVQREAEDTLDTEKKKEREETRAAIKATNTQVERATLGDLVGLQQLKEQFEGNAQDDSAVKEAAAKKVEAKAAEAIAKEAKATEEAKAAEVAAEEAKAAITVEETPAAEVAAEEVETEVAVEEAPAAEVAVEVAETEVAVEEAPVAEVTAKASKATSGADDLKKIEGIGPKIAELLNEGGIHTFAELASTDVSRLQEILDAAGSRYKMHDPTTWPNQSELARDGKWDELGVLQDSLKGGRPE